MDQSDQCAKRRARTIEIGFGNLCAFPIADLKPIAARILEEDGLVVLVFVDRSFKIPCTGLDGDHSQPLNLLATVGPDRNPALVGNVLWRLRHPEKLWRAIGSSSLILQPPLDFRIAREPECWQEGFVKWSRHGRIAHSEINMIETTLHNRT